MRREEAVFGANPEKYLLSDHVHKVIVNQY